MNRMNSSLVAWILSATAISAAADVGDRGGAERLPRPPVAPLASELQGFIEAEVERAMAMEKLADLESLEAMGRFEHLKALDALSEIDVEDVIASRSARTELALADARAVVDRANERANDRDYDSSGPTIDERRPLNADGRIYVNNVAGTIDIASWDRNEVTIGGTLGSSVEKLEISGDPSSLSVVVKLPKKSHSSGDTVLKLRVPVGARVELESVSADVAVDGTRGPVKVNTVSGDVGLALASPEVTVQTVSGDLKLRSPSRLTKVNSVSGDLRMAGLQGKLTVETVSGNVELEGGKFSELRLKSISGDMRLDVSLDEAAQITGETLSGEITVIVPVALTGTALLKSFSGEARCDGAHAVDYHNGRKREYVWGDGKGARIELSSFSGDIRIERK